MKKFTLSHTGDSDSSRSVQSLHGSNEAHPESELPRITVLTVSFPSFGKKTCLKVIGDAVLLDIKHRLLKVFGSLLSDGQNMGLFLPGDGGKMGKFLEEERLLSEYACEKPELLLEFVYKQRMVPPVSVSSPLVEKFSKDLTKAFLRYVSRGDHKKVEKFLSKGFDPNFQCPKTGETPLTIAVTRSKPYNMISVLIAGGAHRDYYSKSGMTPLHKAAAARNFEAVKTLLDFGQSPNCRDQNGLTPLYLNILCDPEKRICHRLLYEHSELGVANQEGLQEIHQAARLNRVEQINLLVMYGVDVNSRCVRAPGQLRNSIGAQTSPRSTSEDTPLHVAAAAGQRDAVIRLLSWGADPTLVNLANQTAVQVAQACGYAELAETIRLFRGDPENGAYDGAFLPTPTYNPHRRMRNPPVNSYISDPTALTLSSTTGTAKDTNECGQTARTTFVSHSFDRKTELMATDKRLSPTDPDINQRKMTHLTKSPLSRAVSMGELVVRGPTKRLPKSVNFNETTQLNKYPNVVSNSFFLATQPQYDSIRDGGVLNGCTLARRPKPSARTSAIYSGARYKTSTDAGNVNEAPRLYAHVQTPNFAKLSQEGPRHLHRLHQDNSITATGTTLQSWKSTDRLHNGFQREGSQTDSGISNSSVEKKPGSSPTNCNEVSNINGCMKNSQSAIFSIKSHQTNGMPDGECMKYRIIRSPAESLRQAVSQRNQKVKPDRSPEPVNTSANRGFRPGIPHTVDLHKTEGVPSNHSEARPSFGLSIRTVKNSDVIANFHPTPNKPSLQVAKRIVPNSPADKAGIREGDFVLKINGVDITRSTLEEVVKLLESTLDNSVCLTVMRPIDSASRRRSADPSQTRHSKDQLSSQTGMDCRVQTTIHPSGGKERKHSTQPTYTFVRPTDATQPLSARSSDRTTCSSIPDEGMWSQSTGPSSTEVSARNSLVSRPRNLDTQVTLVPALRSSMDQRMLSPDNPPNRVRFRGLPRSRTTTGIATDQINQPIPQAISQSLYFARNPQFRRVGSEDSQSSVSSGGQHNTLGGTSSNRKPLTRSTSGVTANGRSPRQLNMGQTILTNKFIPVDSTQIRVTRDQLRPVQRSSTAQPPMGNFQCRQRSVQPPLFRNDLLIAGYPNTYHRNGINTRADTPSTTVDSLTDSEIVLPPPVQFRS